MVGKPKIVIVDHHPLFREGMKLLIEKEGIGIVTGEAENSLHFQDLIQNLSPDLVLIEIELPALGSFEAVRRTLAQKPDLKILAMTMQGDYFNIQTFKEAGFKGLLLKSSGKKEIENAITKILSGEILF